MSLGKLIREERTINIYKKTKSKYLSDAIEEISINHISLEDLKNIILPNENDSCLYDGYLLTPSQLDKLNVILKNQIIPNHEKFEYTLECYGIYDRKK